MLGNLLLTEQIQVSLQLSEVFPTMLSNTMFKYLSQVNKLWDLVTVNSNEAFWDIFGGKTTALIILQTHSLGE